MWFLEHSDSDSAGLVWDQIIWMCNKFPGNVDDVVQFTVGELLLQKN